MRSAQSIAMAHRLQPGGGNCGGARAGAGSASRWSGAVAAVREEAVAVKGGGAGAPARGVTINQNVIQKASAKISGEKISGTVEFNEYQVANGGLIQVVYSLEGVPPGTHGVHIHTVGRCDPPSFASAGGHFDPGPAGNPDPDLNHPYHSGDLPNIVANATGAVQVTSYTTRFNLGGPLSPIDADGAAIVIHQGPDTNQTGTKGQGVGGGNAIACGILVK